MRALIAEAGVDARRLRAALALLSDGRWWTLGDLVRESATSRRTIEALLRELPDLEHSGDRFRLPPAPVEAPPSPADPVTHLLPAHAQVVEQMAELIAKAPRGRHVLDHVAATADTVVRRALLLGTRFSLDGARLLCVGDHDLTSLAAAMVHPGLEVTVVDIDDRILGYIAAGAARLGVSVHTRWADLRLGLPPAARAYADLAITDPPYTAEGVGLFVARAAEGLRDRDRGRVLLAYGVSERTPALALKVQHALSALNLVYEAMYPDFNRYHGAEAIGSAADMYVLRPTTKTWPAVSARVDRLATAIYTKGPQSTEAAAPAPGAPGAAGIEVAGGTAEVLVGEWPGDLAPRVPRARLSTWLAKPYAAHPERVAIALPAGLEAALPRLLLATRAAYARVEPAAPLDDLPGLADLLSPVYAISAGDSGGSVLAERVAVPGDEPGRVLRRILDNAHGKVANTWREALIAARAGLTKRQARALIAETAPWAADATPLDLPLDRLRGLRAAIAATLSAA
ncbi:hypothetical protein GCM10023259_031950 [Thermocatellispora tengchongensis]